MNRLTRLPLAIWLLAPLLILTTILGLLSWYVFTPALQRSADISLEVAHSVVKTTGNAALAYPLATGNTEELNTILSSLVRNSVVFAVETYDTSGKLLTRHQNPGIPIELGVAIIEHREKIYLNTIETNPMAELGDPSTGQTFVGEIVYQLTPYPITREQRRLGGELLLGLGILLLTLALLTVLVVRYGDRPMREILGAMKKVGTGEKDVHIEMRSHVSEIAELVKGINFMSAAVDRSATEAAEALDKANRALADAEHAERETRQFFSVAAREIAVPVGRLAQYLKVSAGRVKRRGDASMAQELQIALQSAEELQTTVDGILDRLATEESKEDTAPLHFQAYFKQLEAVYQARFEQKNIAFSTVGPAGPVNKNFRIDARALDTIVNKLLDNAFKYTDSGFVELHWAIKTLAAEEGALSITVRDSGPGIDQDELERIFNKYYRSDSARVREVEGSGLGLYIARTMATNAGGTLIAEGRAGIGSRFTLNLPLKYAGEPDKTATVEAPSLVALIVDDSPARREALESLLADSRVTTMNADTSIEAVLAFEKHTFDIAFLDEALEDPETGQLARLIADKNPQTRILITTHTASYRDFTDGKLSEEATLSNETINKVVVSALKKPRHSNVDYRLLDQLQDREKD